jgi:hypothetical protein
MSTTIVMETLLLEGRADFFGPTPPWSSPEERPYQASPPLSIIAIMMTTTNDYIDI